MPLINQVSHYRKEQGMNQQTLAGLVGVSRQTISLIERGDYHPSVVIALKLAQIFQVSVEDLFTYEEDHNEKDV